MEAEQQPGDILDVAGLLSFIKRRLRRLRAIALMIDDAQKAEGL